MQKRKIIKLASLLAMCVVQIDAGSWNRNGQSTSPWGTLSTIGVVSGLSVIVCYTSRLFYWHSMRDTKAEYSSEHVAKRYMATRTDIGQAEKGRIRRLAKQGPEKYEAVVQKEDRQLEWNKYKRGLKIGAALLVAGAGFFAMPIEGQW